MYKRQPFNWPKACWGGELRVKLEGAKPEKRKNLLQEWGGTTTASRYDWRKIIQQAKSDKWYRAEFGKVTMVEPHQGNGIITHISTEFPQLALVADFIIDATGLEASVEKSPLIYDFVNKYNLQLNVLQRLTVSNDFEVIGMGNKLGRMYACGAITFGGPYAAVDSFLGLQYTALRSVDNLCKLKAPGIKYLNGFSSIGQWWKWATNQSPS